MSGSVFAVNVLGGLAGSAHGVAVELEAICVVNQAIENGIGKGRFVDDVVPGGDGQLAGDQDRALAVAIFDDFHQVRAFGAMGGMDRLASDRALGLGVAELADTDRRLAAMIATGRRLRDEDGADVLIMGCAGLAQYRAPLERATGLPVVEPCQAAVSMALGQIALGLAHAHQGENHAG